MTIANNSNNNSNNNDDNNKQYLFLIEIPTMQGWTVTARHGITKKEAQKDYSIQEICLERTYR